MKLPQQLETGLPLDIPQGSFRNIPFRMDDRNSTRLPWMLELNVAAFLRDLIPAVGFQGGKHVMTVHYV